MNRTKDVHRLLSKKYTIDMLKSLEEPKRFGDLAAACKSEKMRTQRLREFENLNLVSAKVAQVGRRPVRVYRLSETGKGTLRLAEEIKKLHESK